jgi:Ni/Co efflux regulator RcnB
MNKQRNMWVVCGALLMFFSASAVIAQPQDQDHRDQQQHQDRGQDRGNQDRDNRGHDRNYGGMYDRGRHEGWYKRGGHMPDEYRGGSYVVTDWRSEHLHKPPRGYRYVRSDNGDFLLVAISTGIIASILASH